MGVSDWLERRRLLKAFEGAKNWPPKRPPHLTPANYRVYYSDGFSQETSLLPDEISRWVAACNSDTDKLRSPHPIVRVIDVSGLTVWPTASPDAAPPIKSNAVLKELFVGLVGWLWVAVAIWSLYYLTRVLFFDGSWLIFFGMIFAVWCLDHVTLYYQLEKERRIKG
jgi:hypothetical protein